MMLGACDLSKLALGLSPAPLAACTPQSPEQVAARCEERARAAQAPEFGLTLRANSNSGTFASGSVSISSDLLRGRDPLDVYESCVIDQTGQPPIRPPRLRDV